MKNISENLAQTAKYLGGVAFRVNQDGSGLRPIGHNFRNSYEQAVSSLGDVFKTIMMILASQPNGMAEWNMGNMGFTSRNVDCENGVVTK